MKTWRCGDCGTAYGRDVLRCTRTFDDYLAVHGGSVEAAIKRAVARSIAPLVNEAERRLQPPSHLPAIRWTWKGSGAGSDHRTESAGFPLAG